MTNKMKARATRNIEIAEIIEKHGNSREAVEEIAAVTNKGLPEAGVTMNPYFMKKQPIYSTHTGEVVGYALSNVRISSTHRFCVRLNVLEQFPSEWECYKYFMDGYKSNLLPRGGQNEGRPLTLRTIELYERNKKLGTKFWTWVQAQGANVRESTGYDYVYGYGYYTDNGFVIVNNDDSAAFLVSHAPSIQEIYETNYSSI